MLLRFCSLLISAAAAATVAPIPSLSGVGAPVWRVMLSPRAAAALAACKCSPTRTISPGNWTPPGCQAPCIFVTADWSSETEPGACVHPAPGKAPCPGPHKACSGDVEVEVFLSSASCCQNKLPGGISIPAMYSGCQGHGQTKIKVFSLTANCEYLTGNTDTRKLAVYPCDDTSADPLVTFTLTFTCPECPAQ